MMLDYASIECPSSLHCYSRTSCKLSRQNDADDLALSKIESQFLLYLCTSSAFDWAFATLTSIAPTLSYVACLRARVRVGGRAINLNTKYIAIGYATHALVK